MLRGGITIFCTDLVRTRAFYEGQLGMTIHGSDEQGFSATRDGLELHVEGGARPRKRGRTFYEEAGVLVRIETGEFDTFLGDIVGRGVHLMGQVRESDSGRFAGFVDPDGNLFELIEAVG